jgi:hypothetical protein
MLILNSRDEPEYIGVIGVVYSEDWHVTSVCIELLQTHFRYAVGVRLVVCVWRLQRFVLQMVRPKCALRRFAVMMGCDHKPTQGQASLLRHVPVDVLCALVLQVD